MSRILIIFLYCQITLVLTSVNLAQAKNFKNSFIKGPVQATLIRVVDGDTVLMDAKPWPSQTIRVYVRLRDIDTPELRSKCAKNRIAAKAAKFALINLLEGQNLHLTNISGGKYYGRILADIETSQGVNASGALLHAGHAVPYKFRNKNKQCKSN